MTSVGQCSPRYTRPTPSTAAHKASTAMATNRQAPLNPRARLRQSSPQATVSVAVWPEGRE